MDEFPRCYEDDKLYVYHNKEGRIFIQRKGTDIEIGIRTIGEDTEVIVHHAKKVNKLSARNDESHRFLILPHPRRTNLRHKKNGKSKIS